jgi:hypothetical protein
MEETPVLGQIINIETREAFDRVLNVYTIEWLDELGGQSVNGYAYVEYRKEKLKSFMEDDWREINS